MLATAMLNGKGDLILCGATDPVPWWSFTKTVLAAAILRLVDQGALTIDDPVEGHSFTVRQLLRHEAGLPDYGALALYHEDVAQSRPPWLVTEMLDAAKADRLLFTPGTDWAYSNIGFYKIGQIIEAVSGMTLGAALSLLLFKPAGLSTARLATSSADLDGVQMGAVESYDPGWVYHGLVVGTIAEAAVLLQKVLEGELHEPQTLAAMLRTRPLPQFRSEMHPDPAYGLGVMCIGNGLMGHTGAGPGSHIAVYSNGRCAAAAWVSPPDEAPEKIVYQLLS